jgi:hypothetical protein
MIFLMTVVAHPIESIDSEIVFKEIPRKLKLLSSRSLRFWHLFPASCWEQHPSRIARSQLSRYRQITAPTIGNFASGWKRKDTPQLALFPVGYRGKVLSR